MFESNVYLKKLRNHFLIWTPALIFWTLMRGVGHEFMYDEYKLSFLEHVQLHIAVGAIAAMFFGNLDYFVERFVMRKTSFGKSLVVGSVSYLFAIVLFMFVALIAYIRINDESLSSDTVSKVSLDESMLLVLYCYVVGFCISFVRQVDRKLGPGNLWKMLIGEFHEPKEEDRVFMFLDLQSSTTIAEKLGHINYSLLIQQCFKELDMAAKRRAEIYQYVGDEVILTWKQQEGVDDLNCIKTFFEFQQKIVDKSVYYQNTYGVIPKFKAGLNVGKIVIAEVGEIKSEIAYHGDTINTAARIRGECNRLNSNILISQELLEILEPEHPYEFSFKDKIRLKGKNLPTSLYSVSSLPVP